MKVFPHNFNPKSNSGPNKFTRQLFKNVIDNFSIEIVSDQKSADIEFCLIQQVAEKIKPTVLRLDGIYFNSSQDYEQQNDPIKNTYNNANAVIFQSEFNRKLTEHWFGPHKNFKVIHNAPDDTLISKITSSQFDKKIDPNIEVWSCASSWRPHKRLQENIRYFIEKSSDEAILIIAGGGASNIDLYDHADILGKRIFYLGEVAYGTLLSLFKRSSTFLHLAYLDHCPNVVVDAQACGCHIVCSSTGGTSEIVKRGTIVIEDKWGYEPIELYNPPSMNFDSYIELSLKDDHITMKDCARMYYEVFMGVYDER
jgi:glycosyltransferase involved in cell wall biosynthesis